MNKTVSQVFGFVVLVYGLSSVQAEEKGTPDKVTARGIVVEEIQNPNPQFSVRVSAQAVRGS